MGGQADLLMPTFKLCYSWMWPVLVRAAGKHMQDPCPCAVCMWVLQLQCSAQQYETCASCDNLQSLIYSAISSFLGRFPITINKACTYSASCSPDDSTLCILAWMIGIVLLTVPAGPSQGVLTFALCAEQVSQAGRQHQQGHAHD